MSMLNTLQAHLDIIRQAAGAEAMTLYFPALADNGVSPLLCHAGTLPVRELHDADSAEALCARYPAIEALSPTEDTLLANIHRVTDDTYIVNLSIAALLQNLDDPERVPHAVERRRAYNDPGDAPAGLWLGMQWVTGKAPTLPERLYYQELRSALGVDTEGLTRLLSVSAHLAWAFVRHTFWQQDPMSRLPGRLEFQDSLEHLFGQAVTHGRPFSLLLINPDDFAAVNQRLSRKQGDSVLVEVAERLNTTLRHSDLAFRYGGAVFAVLLPGGGNETAITVADKLRHVLTQSPYASKLVRLAFSIGMAIHDPEQAGRTATDANELLHWADSAINQAKLAGGGRTAVWDSKGDAAVVGSLDRLSGIFTADMEKDYRNMLLLWDTVTFIASHAEGDAIAREFTAQLGAHFKPLRAVLVTNDSTQPFQVLAEYVANPHDSWMPPRNKSERLPLSEAQKRLLDQAEERGRIERLRLDVHNGKAAPQYRMAYAIPMMAAKSYQGCLYIEMEKAETRLDSSDIVFLGALANQVANALSHAFLANRWKQEKERESSLLKQEVSGLRQALRQSKMVFQSPQMHAVMDRLLKVAPTDATVLVTGESGTGKEMLARSLHEMSLRKDQAFITVDCGAISSTLLESELFGRVRGAYTGADKTSAGRILQAEGGTLFLDEVGELPLDVQAKLLRFVQEKEITPVGAIQSRRVDVRLVTATNRNLVEEVNLGRFRQDLYYRLQVFVVDAAPLRARTDDILPLAYYFLEKYCLQYHRKPLHLKPDAEAILLAYPWPGNVRELQNQILKTVVMCTTEDVGANDLQLPTANASTLPPLPHPGVPLPQVPSAPSPLPFAPPPAIGNDAQWLPPQTTAAELSGDPWDVLRCEVQRQLEKVLAHEKVLIVPLGSWFITDLILLADEACDGIARRASSLLGMAETTFRRQVEKARRDRAAGRLTRSPEWTRVGPVLSHLLDSLDGTPAKNVRKRMRGILLEEVMSRLSDQDNTAAALMGVSLPTYRSWKNAAQQQENRARKSVVNIR